MNYTNYVIRTFLIALVVTIIMQLDYEADLQKWLTIVLTTLVATAASLLIHKLLGLSGY